MANRITSIAINCADPELLATFWTAVLGWQVTEREEDGVSIGAPGSPFGIDFFRVPEPKQVKNRLHLDLNATDRDQEAELRGCSSSAPGRPTSARARSAGMCSPTRRATSSACCAAASTRSEQPGHARGGGASVGMPRATLRAPVSPTSPPPARPWN